MVVSACGGGGGGSGGSASETDTDADTVIASVPRCVSASGSESGSDGDGASSGDGTSANNAIGLEANGLDRTCYLALALHDIEHRTTKAHSPRSNGFIEQINRHRGGIIRVAGDPARGTPPSFSRRST